ncbi:MAG: IS110 family transposase [Solirubrobacterales bacterium]
MEVIVERPAALDVHKAQVTACVRVPGQGGRRRSEVREFSTMVGGLLVLRDWLKAHGVTQVAMEATGVYWKPVWAVLEDDFELLLVNARHVKQVPGRKTDVSDAAWLCQLLEAGLLRPSFVPPKPIRAVRQLTRYRKAQIKERQREAQRLHKALEDTGIKLDCVATDILGKSGRAMLDALCRGTTDPEVLADLAHGKLRRKIPQLKQALEGRFEPLHALLVSSILAHLDFLDEQIERLSEAIEAQLRPFAAAVELLRSLDGIETRTAQNVLAEIGVDMSVFPTAGHLASWAGQCPGNDQSAGKRKSGKTRKGSKWLNDALKDAAMAAIKTNDSYLQAQYQRLRPRIGHGRAIGAVKHSIICACWHMLTTGELYRDLGRDYYRRQNPERQTRRLVAQLERHGHKVNLEQMPQAA